jgi:hypothetical protein
VQSFLLWSRIGLFYLVSIIGKKRVTGYSHANTAPSIISDEDKPPKTQVVWRLFGSVDGVLSTARGQILDREHLEYLKKDGKFWW